MRWEQGKYLEILPRKISGKKFLGNWEDIIKTYLKMNGSWWCAQDSCGSRTNEIIVWKLIIIGKEGFIPWSVYSVIKLLAAVWKGLSYMP
jgi:hypothetical protein